jgi:hypothetical protein
VEDEGMRITVVGAVLIAAAVIGTALVIRYLIQRAEQLKKAER